MKGLANFKLSLALCVIAGSVSAQDTRPYELANSNSDLNKAYQTIIRRLSVSDRTNLRTSQRLWIQFRDADCKLAVGDVRDCLLELTDQRTEQLKSTNYNDKSGTMFSLSDR